MGSGSGVTEAPAAHDVDRAIAAIEKNRQTHVDWVAWIERGQTCGDPTCRLTGEEHTKIAGSLLHHRLVIAEYDNVLAVLRSVAN